MAEEEKKPKRKYDGRANLIPFTPMNAKEMAALSAKVRQMRKQMRAKMLETAISEGLDKYLAKAIKNMDPDAIEVVAKASKLVGIDFGSSEESVQRMDVKSDNKVNTSGTLNITFTDAKTDA
jgi:hypothetical protein